MDLNYLVSICTISTAKIKPYLEFPVCPLKTPLTGGNSSSGLWLRSGDGALCGPGRGVCPGKPLGALEFTPCVMLWANNCCVPGGNVFQSPTLIPGGQSIVESREYIDVVDKLDGCASSSCDLTCLDALCCASNLLMSRVCIFKYAILFGRQPASQKSPNK